VPPIRIAGFPPSSYYLSHVLPEYRKRIYEAIDGLEKGCSKLIDEEFLYQNADNTLSWRNIYGIIYEYDEGGKPAILIGGTQIIDERKKTGKRFAESERQRQRKPID